MPPSIKDSDTLTASEPASRPGSTASSDSPTKPQPVALEVPIAVNGARTVEGSDKREPFSESTKTVMVHGRGAVIKLNSALAAGQLLFLTNERTKKEVVCQVVKSKGYRNVSGYVELEFTEPAVGFWGMRFPGDRIAPGPQAAPEANRPAATNPAPAVAQKLEPPSPVSAPVSVREKPSTPAPVLSKPATPAPSGSSIVPAPIDSASLLGTAKPKPNSGVPASPVTTSFAAEEPLIEPWLRKREPVSRVPAEPPRAAGPEPVRKTDPAAGSQPPVRNFELARPSDRPASLFTPPEAAANPAMVDLSSLARFFEVKPAPTDRAPAAPRTAPATSDPEAEELNHHTARLEEELSQLRLAESAPSSPAKPTIDTLPISADEPSCSLPKAEPVHESAAQLLEHPVESRAPVVLPEVGKLEEPLKVEPPSPIPALEFLPEEELKIPAWLEPLARSASAPSPTKELAPREKPKRTAEQPPLEELMAPLAAPIKEERAAGSHLPQFGSALPFEGVKRVREDRSANSRSGLLFAALAAGMVLLAAGGWRYKNQHRGGVLPGTSARQAPETSDGRTNRAKEAALAAMLPVHKDSATVSAGPDAGDSNVPVNAAKGVPSSAAAGSATAGNGQSASHGGTAVTVAETVEPESSPAAQKKPALGEVHFDSPKISPKRTAQSGSEPDLSEETPESGTAALGAELGPSKQPAAPAAPAPVGGEVRQARLISSVPPEYPALAKAQHISGGVTIDALIEPNGRVTKMKVLSGPALLQQAAMDAMRQWKYQPAMLDGKAVPMHLTVTIQFRLQQ